MKPLLDIIIPSFNNPVLLSSCLNSLRLTMVYPLHEMVRIIVVNNGHPGMKEYLATAKHVTVLESGKNLGWEGGLKLGLESSTAPFVMFANDDIRFVSGTNEWFWRLISLFNDPSVGAVGPCSNFVMGPQNIFSDICGPILDVKYLIGYCMIIRREALNKAGGVDDSLPGGDDIDLSIRLRDAGYRLLARRDTFVFHHGQATGNRVKAGYWNSPQMQESTNLALIKKHGMLKYFETMIVGHVDFNIYEFYKRASSDIEGDICRKHVVGEKILDLGCGGRKTHEKAIGVDHFSNGKRIPLVTEESSSCVATINADASVEIPVDEESQDTIIARHLLEHCQDTLGTLSVWNRALRKDGVLILAVPNHELGNTIVMNPEHLVSFTPLSLKNQATVCGFQMTDLYVDVNGVSFVGIFKKTGLPHSGIFIPPPTKHCKGAELVAEGACA